MPTAYDPRIPEKEMGRAIRWTGVLLVVCAAALRAPASASEATLVPWKVLEPGAVPPKSAFTLYWVPSSREEMRRSDLITSRRLLFYSGRCVAMNVIRADDHPLLAKLAADSAPLAILREGENEIARVTATSAAAVEAMVRQAIDTRELSLNAMLDGAAKKAADGDREKAIELYRAVAAQACAFPRLAKTARRALRRLGVKE